MRKFAIVLMTAIVLAAGSAMAATNLNSATEQQLESLNGVGPVKAKAIIDYRQKNGPFKSVQDLKNVPGFGDKTVASLSPQLSVSGTTTASAAPTAMPASAPQPNSKMPAGSTAPAAAPTPAK